VILFLYISKKSNLNKKERVYIMEIGEKNFKTKKSAEEYVRSIIERIGLCKSIKTRSKSDYNFFIDLFRRHPKYPEKIYNICDISIQKNKINSKYLELHIIKEDGTTDDISWRNCISGSERDKFKCALRVAINDQIMHFKYNNTNKCELCKTINADSYHVDHIMHFEEIVFEFLNNTTKDKPTIFKNIGDNRKAFTENDIEYEEEWKNFHKEHAQLRILCSVCNLKRPKWKNVQVD